MWQNYQTQKSEILELLERAERELRRVGAQPSRPKDVAAELKDKQELSKALRQATEELLRRLRDLCAALQAATAPERRPLLQKEVHLLSERF